MCGGRGSELLVGVEVIRVGIPTDKEVMDRDEIGEADDGGEDKMEEVLNEEEVGMGRAKEKSNGGPSSTDDGVDSASFRSSPAPRTAVSRSSPRKPSSSSNKRVRAIAAVFIEGCDVAHTF